MEILDCNILLVDDEKDILETNERLLREKGFRRIDTASCGWDAEEKLSLNGYHLVVLDIMMPDVDGLSLYGDWIKKGRTVPVIFLSARDGEEVRLKGLGLGADDYITKPYTFDELYLRMKVVLRRTYHLTENQVIRLGDVTVDLSSGIVHGTDGDSELTAKEFLLLRKLNDNRGRIVSMDSLMDTLWPDGSYGMENSLVVHIRRLREKIESNPSKPQFLQTVRGSAIGLWRRRNETSGKIFDYNELCAFYPDFHRHYCNYNDFVYHG